MIYPNKLKEKSIIKIISPSNGVKTKKIAKYEKAIENLENYGFIVTEDKYVRNSNKGVSSNAKNRALEFNKALNDKNNNALIACSGGDYLIQILDMIKFNKLNDNIKWIQGQSDITSLLFYITTKYDIATIYSFNIKVFGESSIPKIVIDNNIKFLKGLTPKQTEFGFKVDDRNIEQKWECISGCNTNLIEGRIIGGCLDSLKDIIGTKYDAVKKYLNKYKNDGIVWYFDVAEMTNEDILRTMWQFKKAGWFKYCKGILFGRLDNEITYTDTSLSTAIKYNLDDLNIPILINTDIGHTSPVLTIINGSIVKIEKNDKYTMETFLI